MIKLFNDSQAERNQTSNFVFSDQSMLIGGLAWKHVTKTWFMNVTAANSYGNYAYFLDQADTSKSSRITSYENEASLSIDGVAKISSSAELSAGMKIDVVRFQDNADLGKTPWFMILNTDLQRLRRSVDSSGRKTAAYIQVSQSIDDISLTAGIRADHFNLIKHPFAIGSRFSVMSRLSASIELRASAGRYYQAPAYFWFVNPYNTGLTYAGADQLVVGITNRLDSEWKFTLEGYRKKYFDYPASLEVPCATIFNAGSLDSDFKDFGVDSLISRGSGKSQGIELFLQKQMSDDPISGSLSLSYGVTDFTALDGITRPADHDERWVMNLVIDYHEAETWEVIGKFRLYTGHPYTDRFLIREGGLEEYARGYNALRVGLNHMLDVRVIRRWLIGESRIEAFLDVQNIYNKKPLDTPSPDPQTGVFRDTGMIGIVPSIGIKVSL
jgi:hypothetical protein